MTRGFGVLGVQVPRLEVLGLRLSEARCTGAGCTEARRTEAACVQAALLHGELQPDRGAGGVGVDRGPLLTGEDEALRDLGTEAAWDGSERGGQVRQLVGVLGTVERQVRQRGPHPNLVITRGLRTRGRPEFVPHIGSRGQRTLLFMLGALLGTFGGLLLGTLLSRTLTLRTLRTFGDRGRAHRSRTDSWNVGTSRP